MKINKTIRRLLAMALTMSMMWMDVGRVQAMLAPAALANPAFSADRNKDLNAVRTFLEQKQVRQRLADFQMSPEDIQTRMNSLSDRDLHHVAMRIDKQNPAGDASGAVITVLVIGILALLFVYLSRRV
jgi:hypothetical protein